LIFIFAIDFRLFRHFRQLAILLAISAFDIEFIDAMPAPLLP
jgi:hypothetical protein